MPTTTTIPAATTAGKLTQAPPPPFVEVSATGRARSVTAREASPPRLGDVTSATPAPVPVEPNPAPSFPKPAAVVLFGRDQRGRPHAARFGAEDAELAQRAGMMTGLRVLSVGAEHIPVTALLPQGRVFASGKAFVPFVRQGTYDRIELAAEMLGGKGEGQGGGDPKLPATASGRPEEAHEGSEPAKAPAPAKVPEGPSLPPRDAKLGAHGPVSGKDVPDPTSGPLAVGTVVLACQGPMEGWFEAVVQGIKAPGLYELSWRDWPLDPRILRRGEVLAQLPAAMAWQTPPRG